MKPSIFDEADTSQSNASQRIFPEEKSAIKIVFDAPELFERIMTYLDPTELCKTRLVERAWNQQIAGNGLQTEEGREQMLEVMAFVGDSRNNLNLRTKLDSYKEKMEKDAPEGCPQEQFLLAASINQCSKISSYEALLDRVKEIFQYYTFDTHLYLDIIVPTSSGYCFPLGQIQVRPYINETLVGHPIKQEIEAKNTALPHLKTIYHNKRIALHNPGLNVTVHDSSSGFLLTFDDTHFRESRYVASLGDRYGASTKKVGISVELFSETQTPNSDFLNEGCARIATIIQDAVQREFEREFNQRSVLRRAAFSTVAFFKSVIHNEAALVQSTQSFEDYFQEHHNDIDIGRSLQ